MSELSEETKILFVDHRDEAQVTLIEKLSAPGYSFVQVDSLIEGFRHLIRESFDLIFFHAINEMDEVANLIKKLANMYEIPIFVI